ncbi:MAG: WYL domain-containing protein [Chloroflexi bacterium]|nr:MAG: WYL domain-containing protein [Chloroflexota bacterium]
MFDFAEKRPFETPLVILDTETTGLHPWLGHRIVEIGAIRLENGQVIDTFNQMLDPGRSMDPAATAVNGIQDSDLIGQPLFSNIIDDLLSFLDGALIVAHNAGFDADYLGMELFIDSYASTKPSLKLSNPWLCTLQLARKNFHFGQNNLGHIAQKLGVRIGRAHRALNDVYTTSEVLKRMVAELEKQRMNTVGDLLLAQGGPIYATTPELPFLSPIIQEALDTQQSLRIVYKGQRRESQRVITPFYPTYNLGNSYLIAHCHLNDEQRTFRIDRIVDAELVPSL